MAWENLYQTTLVDAVLIERGALKELGDVHELIDWSRIQSLLVTFHSSRRGEKALPPLMILASKFTRDSFNALERLSAKYQA